MKIPRWIRDENPEQSIKDRVENILFVIVNNKTKDDSITFITDRQLLFWILDELTALWNKLEKEKLNDKQTDLEL